MKYNIVPNGLWTQEVPDDFILDTSVLSENITVSDIEHVLREFNNTGIQIVDPSVYEPERQFIIRTGPEGQRMFEEALDTELTNISRMTEEQLLNYLDTL